MAQARPQKEVLFSELIQIFNRRIHYFFSVFVVIFIVGLVSTLTRERIYQASAKLEIGEPVGQRDFLGYLSSLGQARRVDTEIEIIKSRSIIAEVVRRLHLNVIPDDPRLKVYAFDLTRPGGSYILRWKGNTAWLKGPDHQQWELHNGVVFQKDGMRFQLEWPEAASGVASIRVVPVENVVPRISGNLEVKKAGTMSNIVWISYRDTDPVRAMNVVNTLLDVYRQKNREKWSQAASQTLQFLEKQIERTRASLEMVESQLDRWREKTGYVQLSGEVSNIIDRLSDFEMRKVELEMREREVNSLLEALTHSENNTLSTVSSISVDDPIVNSLLQRLTDLEVQKGALLAEYTEAHPAVQNIQARIRETREKIVDVLNGVRDGIRKKKQSLSRIIARYDAQLRALPEAERRLARLERMAKVNEGIYTYLLQKHEETRIAKAATLGNARVIDPAVLPRTPVEPRVGRSLMMFFALAFLFGVTAVLLAEHLDDTARTPEDLQGRVNIPVLGIIPLASEVSGGKRLSRRDVCLIKSRRKDVFLESMRTLRTNLKYLGEGTVNSFLVTSPGGMEGKSTVTVNIAYACAVAGLKSVVVDCDLRKPVVHRIFGVKRTPGLTDFIVDPEVGKEGIIRHFSDNLSFVTAGEKPPNPTELLNTDSVKRFIEELKREFDMVFIDSPPVLAVADALVLSSLVEQVLVVVEARRTRVSEVENTINMLKNVSAPIGGIVFNRVRYKDLHPYGYNYYYYYEYTGEEPPPTGLKRIAKRVKREVERVKRRYEG